MKRIFIILLTVSRVVATSQVFVEQIELTAFNGDSYEAANYIHLKPGFQVNASTDGSFNAIILPRTFNFQFNAYSGFNGEDNFKFSWKDYYQDNVLENDWELEVTRDATFNEIEYSYTKDDALTYGSGPFPPLHTTYYGSEVTGCKGTYYARIRTIYSNNRYSGWTYVTSSSIPSPEVDISYFYEAGYYHMEIDWISGRGSTYSQYVNVATDSEFTNVVFSYHPEFGWSYPVSFQADYNTNYYVKFTSSFCNYFHSFVFETTSPNLPLTPNQDGLEEIILESPDNDWAIYPNPSKGIFYLKGNSDIQSLQIVNMNGQIIKEETVESTRKVNIDLSSYPDGIYLLILNKKSGYKKIPIAKKSY